MIAETDSTNTVAVEYIFGDDLLAQNRSGTLSNYQYDGLGSTRVLSDSTGNVSDEYFYDAFGVELARTGNTENDYLFTGEQYDAGLGNYYLRARYYDQGMGRFTQQDTWMGRNSDPITLHKYLYAGNDPVNNIDPSGYSFVSISDFSIANSIAARMTTLAIHYPRTAILLEAAAGAATPIELAALSPVTCYLLFYHHTFCRIIHHRMC